MGTTPIPPADGPSGSVGSGAPGAPAALDRRAAAGSAAEQALALYRAIFVRSTEPIAIVDPHGVYLEQNAAHEALIGYSDDELRGRTPAIHLGEAEFAPIAAELAATGVCRRECESRTKGGRRLVVELSAFAVRDAAGAPVCYVGIKRDVGDQKRAAAELLGSPRPTAAAWRDTRRGRATTSTRSRCSCRTWRRTPRSRRCAPCSRARGSAPSASSRSWTPGGCSASS